MIYQSKIDDCGKACVRNILCLLHKNDGYATSPLSSECNSFLLIREELEKFEAKYTSYETDDVLKISKDRLPCVAQLLIDDKLHFVVIFKIKNKMIHFIDPEFGIISMKKDDFQKEFTGKVLLKDTFKPNPGFIKMKLLKTNEDISYILCFIFQSLTLSLAIFSTGFKNPFIITLISFLSFFVLNLLHNALNIKVQNRLEKDVLLPYIENNEDKEDFNKLSKILSLETERKSKTVSYLTLLILLLILLVLNSYYLAFLSLIALLCSYSRLFLKKKKANINRFCSCKEMQFLKSIEMRKCKRDLYYQAKKLSIKFLITYLFSWIFEATILLIFIIFELNLLEKMNINYIFYYLSLSLSFSVFVEKLYETIMNKDEEIKMINSLSRPLPFFLLKSELEINYNNGEGENNFNATKLHSRVSKSSKQKSQMETNV